ncbi:FAD-dependent oxidoreductase [Nocardioides sp. 31GB23]|uniref:FAD-dependent oxidoreductase n=1 Tax=Nocardioides sp. 31GB23 TaxID=3156065 RepID=UPI0032AFAD7A
MAHKRAEQYDVVVVGGGLAGLCAATAAAERGSRTLLLEAGPQLGGSTRTLGGVIYAAGTSVQKAAGITDGASDLLASYLLLNQYCLEPSIVRTLAESAAAALDWLVERGVDFPPDQLYSAAPGDPGRSHRARGRGPGLVDPLATHLRTTSADIRTGTRATGLDIKSGRVAGVRIGGDVVPARVVVLATGGYGNAPDLLNRFYPTAAGLGAALHYVGAASNRGDGITMGLAAGAQFTGADRGLLLLAPEFATQNEPALPPELILVNAHGHRFMAEDLPYSVAPGIVAAQTGGTAWALFDERARLSFPPRSSNSPARSWTLQRFADAQLPPGIHRAWSLDSLSRAIGLPADAVEQTVLRYNQLSRRGVDADWEKDAAHLLPCSQSPFYAVRVRPRVLVLTSGGLRIDTAAHVLGQAGRPIMGLFAAGETTGGVIGDRYIGGLVNTSSAVFGIRAGTLAARG